MSQNPSAGGDPALPAAPPVSAAELSSPPRPAMVSLAAKLSWAAAACWLLSSVLGQLMGSPGALAFTFYSTRTIQQGEHSSVTYTETYSGPMSAPVSLIIFAFIAALWVLLIFRMRKGANGARIMLTILGVVGILGQLNQVVLALGYSQFNAGGFVQGMLGIAVIGLVVAALIAMYQSSASEYFRRRLRS